MFSPLKIGVFLSCLFLLLLHPIQAPAAGPDPLNYPGILSFVNAQSQKRSIALRVTPPDQDEYTVKIAVNARRALVERIHGAETLNIPVPGTGILRFKAYLHKRGTPAQQVTYISQELIVDARNWIQAYRLQGYAKQRSSGPTLKGLRLVPKTRKMAALPTHYKAVGSNFKLSPELRITLNKSEHKYRLQNNQSFHLPQFKLKKGSQSIHVELNSAWLPKQSWRMQVRNIGVDPPGANFILVDKYNMTLYFFKNYNLQKRFPIAIGTPKTPTPPGLFYLGPTELMPNPKSDWGERRLKIFSPKNYFQHKWSGYAIHGTNKPQSIGKEVSHGCVRMFNSDIRWLSQHSIAGMPVLIVEKMSNAL